MRSKYLAALFCSILCINTVASEDKYEICLISGYMFGANEQFLGQLAFHIRMKQPDLLSDPMCTAAYQMAYKMGEKFSSTGKFVSEQDQKVVLLASDFTYDAYEAISKLMGY